MNQNDESNNTSDLLRSDVWDDPEAQESIAITAGAKVAAHFNECGEIVIIQQEMSGEGDQAIIFEHEHLQALIARLAALAAENPEDYYSDGYREALRFCAWDRL